MTTETPTTLPTDPQRALRTISHLISFEKPAVLADLTTPEALLAFARLWEVYGVHYLDAIEDEILAGADPTPLIDFVEEHGVGWNLDWMPSAGRRRHRARRALPAPPPALEAQA